MKEELKAFWHYTIGKFFYQTPPILTLFVTNQCNACCQHCFYWKNLEKEKKELPLEEIKKLSRQLGHLETLLIGGGEPFLHQDLAAIVKVFFENNQLGAVSVATNGLLPARIETQAKKIIQISPKLPVIICLSIDGTEKRHDQIRRVKGAFKSLQETYQRLLKLKKKYPNLRIRFNATVFNLNYENLFPLIDQMPQLFPETPAIWNLGLSLIRGNPRNPKLRLPEIAKLKKLFAYKRRKFKAKRSWTARLFEKITFAAQIKILEEKKQAVPCEAGRLLGVVSENGDIGFCELLKPLGNIRNQSFSEIWWGEKAQKMRKRMTQKKCFCTHECVLSPSLLAHPLVWPKLIRK